MNKVRISLRSAWLIVACCVVLSAPAIEAQSTTTGALTIIVKDTSGAVILGATVTVSNNSGLTRTNQTNADGNYTFTLLPPDNYEVTISATGFRPLETPSVAVHVSETEVFNGTMQIGEQQQSVQVTSEASALQTETSAMGGVVEGTSVMSLPLVSRNYLQIMNLSPGVEADVTNASALGLGNPNIFVNGKDNTNTNFHLNGVTVMSYEGGGEGNGGFNGSAPNPSPDAIAEFNVQTSNYDASYGRQSGGNVNVITKSGTNEMHGTAFEYLRNTDLNANLFFLKQNGVPRGVLNQNQYGGTLGGPIKKDKLFYLISYQGTGQKNGIASGSSTTPSLPEQLTNDRSLLTLENEFCSGNPNNASGQPGFPYAHTFAGGQQVKCPSGGTQVPLDTPGGLSSVAYDILNAKLANGAYSIPTPTRIVQSSTGSVGQTSISIPATFNDKQALADVDYKISAKNYLALRYFYDFNAQVLPITGTLANGGQRSLQGSQVASVQLTSMLTPHLVNQAMYGHFYLRASFVSLEPTTVQQLGMTPADPSNSLVPAMVITGLFTAFGSQFDGGKTPTYYNEWSDQISWDHGRHNISAGFEQQTIHYWHCSCGKLRGQLTFQSFADFLLGESAAENGSSDSNVFASAATIQLLTAPNLFTTHEAGVFIQDDFKVSKRLTLNMGLRWEYLGTLADRNPLGGSNGNWVLDQTVPVPPATGTYVGWTVKKDYGGPTLPAGVIKRSTDLFTNGLAPLDNFAPRLGFAWQPFGNRLVVRGGSGFFYDMTYGDTLDQTAGSTPPNASQLSYTGTQNALATFAAPFNPIVPPGTWAGYSRTPTSSVSQHSIDPNLITPLTFAWNLNIQYAITPSLVFGVGYVGNRDEHQEVEFLQNIPTLATATTPVNCGGPSGCITTNTAANAAQRVPVLGFGIADVQTLNNAGDANYNSLQLSLQKRFSHGLQFQFSYTYGRCLSDMVGASSGNAGLAENSGDPTNLRQEYGPCDYNRPQRFVVNYTYNLPASKSDNNFISKASSGWSVSGVTTVQTGFPLTITDTRGGAVYGNPDVGISQTAGSSRAQFCPGEGPANVPTLGNVVSRVTHYFNSSAFCAIPIIGVVNGVGGATGYGNSGRGIVLGPGQFNWDISLVKKTVVGGLREGATLEFRSEFFNAFNHPQFANPNTTLTSSAFGVITATNVGPRVVQFALRYAF